MLLSVLVIFTAFVVGFSMKRGGLCTYGAVLQVVNQRKVDQLLVFLGIIAWATLTLLSLVWLYPADKHLALSHYDLLLALLGGAILGLGAFFNKGCFFGTFVALVSGNINYLVTLIGLAFGVIFTHAYLTSTIPITTEESYLLSSDLATALWFMVMVLLALYMLIRLYAKNKIMLLIMLIIGIGASLLYATVDGWSYGSVLTNTTLLLSEQRSMGATNMAIMTTLSMIVGGITAAVVSKEFTISSVQLSLVLGCFVGGSLMGSVSILIPGGNDGFLLKGIPSLAPHAFVGYASMLLSMLVLVYFFRNTYKR